MTAGSRSGEGRDLGSPAAPGVLAEREFRLFFIGQAASAFGDQVAPIAMAFAVLNLTGSASDLGIVIAARMLPMLFLLGVAGVWADRLPRQIVMLTADVLRCGAQGATAALLLTHQARIWELAALQVVYGAAEAFFTPATTGLVPSTVSPGRLQQANALLGLSRSMIGIFGAAAGGAVVALASPGIALAVDAGTFAVSAVSLSMLRPAQAPRGRRGASMLEELREGWREVRSRRWLTAMIVYFSVFNLVAWPPFLVLGPYVARSSLGGASAWAAILTTGAIGSVLGGIFAMRVVFARPLLWIQVACLTIALPPALLAVGAPVPAIAVGALVASASLALANAVWQTTLQQQIPERAISRVSALDWTVSLIFNPLGFAVVGPLSGRIGAQPTLALAAAVTAASTLATIYAPSIRRFGGPAPAPASMAASSEPNS